MQVFLTLLVALMPFFQSQAPLSRVLVRINPENKSCLEKWWSDQRDKEGREFKVMPIDTWVALQVDGSQLNSLRTLDCVMEIRPDRQITYRKVPNDPIYLNQGDMNLIGMPKAWDITTGGVTTSGDTIVVAVLDDGFFVNHADLAANIFHNRNEVADDGIDNDNNGYVDDYIGYNVATENDDHAVLDHGTGVSGIIGGVGNNGKGMSGVNWKVKIMPVSGAIHESQIISNYAYVLEMRRAYRLSNGAEGAFVVATNLSAGIDGEFAEDHPLWCEMYDMLGAEGILNIVATANNPVDVDEEGDMPSTCTSPFMIAVTNVDLTDQLFGNGAYGPVSVDIGAPGQGTTSLNSTGGVKDFPGTSAAAPHVAGAVALIYSTPCTEFLNGIDVNPAFIAEKVRDAIYDNAKANPSLQNKTVTGARLQVDDALEAIKDDCGNVPDDGIIMLELSPNPTENQDVKASFIITGQLDDPRIDVVSSTGALIRRHYLSPTEVEVGEYSLRMEDLAAAVYIVSVWNGKKKVSRKLVHL